MAESAQTSTDDDDNGFVVSIDDTSPTIVYSPFADTFAAPSLATGWNPFFSDSGFVNQSSSGVGTTFHVTSADGASLRVQWNGTAATLYGFFNTSLPAFPSAVSYSVSLDGVSTTNYASSFTTDPDSQDNILAAFTNLTNGEHFLELALHSSGNVSEEIILLMFDRVVLVHSALPASTDPSTSQTVTIPDDLIAFHGQWSFTSQLLPNQTFPLHSSTNVGDSASLQFNGSAVVLSGLTTPLSGSYNISLDNAPPTTFSARSSFNASSPTVLFYTSGLDPSVVHQLKVVNIGASTEDGGSLLLFGTVNVTTTGTQNGGGKKMSSGPTGRTIAAICAVVIVVSIAFVIFLVILLRRRGRVARRKQAFIVNHDVRRERFSFLTRSRLQQDVEKTSPVSNHADESQHESDVLDITAAKHGGDEQDSDDEDNDLQGLHDPQVWHPRHGSQNSDGSYAIDLPELPRPGTGRVRTRSTSESPSPTHRFSDQQARPAKFSLTPSSPTPCSTPRSPKPRGPREMRTVVSTHSKDTSRGILLKEMYSPVADVPVDVRTNDSLLSAGAYLPQPVISPLRVNFEDVLPYEADRRRDAKHRSETSRISLPYSLKQALTGHIRPTYGRDASLANAIGGSPASRFSFLDLNSSNASISSRSNRQSRSASTRSSLKQKGTTPPSNSTPPMPEDPRISLGFSMIMAGGPTASQPSMSPDISLQAVSLSPITIPDHPLPPHIDVPIGVHPTNTSELPSPSDSIPRTLSDIHFRHSTQSCSSPVAESHRTSHRLSVSQRASHHPPLPAASTLQIPQQAEQRPYIVQKILGLPTGSGPSTPYGSPTVSGFASRWSRGRGSASVAGPSSYSRPRTGPPG